MIHGVSASPGSALGISPSSPSNQNKHAQHPVVDCTDKDKKTAEPTGWEEPETLSDHKKQSVFTSHPQEPPTSKALQWKQPKYPSLGGWTGKHPQPDNRMLPGSKKEHTTNTHNGISTYQIQDYTEVDSICMFRNRQTTGTESDQQFPGAGRGVAEKRQGSLRG